MLDKTQNIVYCIKHGESKKMKCHDCQEEISEIRLEAVPDTCYCVKCADKHSEPVVARMIYSHKTAGEVIIARGKENVRRLNREYSRAR
jgi:NAD-dependent SIR2 family protein deacetylase